MGRIFGLLLGMLGIWAMVEVYQHGTQGAFGGAFASLSGEAAVDGGGRSLGQRAGDSVGAAQAEADARRERMLAE